MRIVYVQYTNPAGYPPLEHSSRILAERGWRVLFLGTGTLGSDALRFPPHPLITVRSIKHCPAGFRQKLHYVWFCIWALLSALAWRAKWVYASDPLSCPVSLLLSYAPGIRVLYHEHDSPSAATQRGFLAFVSRARHSLARRAKLCVLPNQRRAERFAAECGKSDVVCVWNCPSQSEVVAPRDATRPDNIWLLYHGSITADRLPLSLVKAFASLPGIVKWRIIGYETVGSLGYLEQIKKLALSLGISQRIEFVGTLPFRSDLLRYCSQSDIGLAFMPQNTQDPNMRTMAGASNKAFDYMACGLAVVVSNLPDWQDMFVEPGYGIPCDPEDPVAIAQALGELISNPAEMRAMGERGRQRIAREWNYEHQFHSVLTAVEG